VTAAARALLALVAAAQAEIGFWGEIGPRSFYDRFPGFGHHWVAPIGPYDEHLVRDYAAAELGFAVLLVAAAVRFSRRVVLIAGAAFLIGTLPHFVFHLTTTDRLSSTDNVLELGAFAVEIVAIAAAMLIAVRAPCGVPPRALA
jgi:hypothetical protein